MSTAPEASSRPPRDALVTPGALVLLALSANHEANYNELARYAAIKTRTVPRILNRLEAAGYLSREGLGRASKITLHPEAPLRAPNVSGTVGDLLAALNPPTRSVPRSSTPAA